MLYKKPNNNIRTCQYSNSNIHWSVAEYNRNNAWYYNGNNGQLNNNNKYNEQQSVPVLELHLKHCNAYKLKKENVDKLKNSKWKIVFDFADDYSKVNIKKEYSKLQYYIYHNKKHKKKFLELKYQLTCI